MKSRNTPFCHSFNTIKEDKVYPDVHLQFTWHNFVHTFIFPKARYVVRCPNKGGRKGGGWGQDRKEESGRILFRLV